MPSLHFELQIDNLNQVRIEDRLFRTRYGEQKPELYLYDVTSSYLEGVCNELAAFQDAAPEAQSDASA